MISEKQSPNRRNFLTASAAFTTGMSGLAMTASSLQASEEKHYVVGPIEGYSPQIGTLVSMLTYMRSVVLDSLPGLTQKDLDYLLDSKANTMGALLSHLAAVDAWYHIHTFGGNWDQVKQKWEVALNLGGPARQSSKGHDLSHYLNLLKETRESTLAEFRKRDDAWLLSTENVPKVGPMNNYWKWFHVCEHESNHNGQIRILRSRLPGAKADNG